MHGRGILGTRARAVNGEVRPRGSRSRSSRDAGMRIEEESPRPAGREANANARSAGDAASAPDRGAIREPEGPCGQVEPVVRAGEPERARDVSWPLGERVIGKRRSAAGPHLLEALDRLERAHQDRGGGARRLGDEIQAVVHAVGEVDVGPPRHAEHDGVARGPSTMGMARGITPAAIRLDFDDASGDTALGTLEDEEAPERRARHRGAMPRVERARQRTPQGWLRAAGPPARRSLRRAPAQCATASPTPRRRSGSMNSARISSSRFSVRASNRTTSTGCVFDARTRPHPSPNSTRAPSMSITR